LARPWRRERLFVQKKGRALEVDDLLTFVEIADAGGVAAAARRMGLSKSVVSRRLYRLEAEMGAQLVARTTRGAALTEAGAAFRDYAARIGAELEAAREVVSPQADLRAAFVSPRRCRLGQATLGRC
jgi:DNA-binding transcriptional LysR family regulator